MPHRKEEERKAQGTAPETTSSTAAPNSAATTATRQEAGRGPKQGPPILEPWMRSTVVLKMKEVDGRRPDMSPSLFSKKMVLEQGFSKAETLCINALFTGIFYITFASINACRRYWEMVKSATPDSPFNRFVGACPVQREERRITVSMRNPHIPGKDITTFLQRFCTVVKEPSHILDDNGFWTSKWSVIVRLNKDPAAEDGVQHLPQSFSMGNSKGLIYYPDMPQICRRCGKKDHTIKDCTESACWICRVAGHETKDCPRKTACNLCGQAAHIYKDCPMRQRSYASVIAQGEGNAVRAPASAVRAPATAVRAPASAERAPASAVRAPATAVRAPATTAQAPTPKANKKKEQKKKEGKKTAHPTLPSDPIHATPPTRILPPTEEISFNSSASSSVAILPADLRATQPPNSPAPERAEPPPLTMEEYPPLAAASSQPRKRKTDESDCTESSKKKVVEVTENQLLPEEEEMEQMMEKLVSDLESQEPADIQDEELEEIASEILAKIQSQGLEDMQNQDLLDRLIEEGSLVFTENPDPEDGKPPDPKVD